MLWQVDIYPAEGQADLAGKSVAHQAAELGIARNLHVVAARGYLIEGEITRVDVEKVTRELLSDAVVEHYVIGITNDASLAEAPSGALRQVHVLPKPGVMDPAAQSALAAINDLGVAASAVRTLRKYWFSPIDDSALRALCGKVLANDAIEQWIAGPLVWNHLELGSKYDFKLVVVPLSELDDAELARLSREGQLYLQLPEMRTIQAHFRHLGRDPTDIELETIAQTWSEHCSHKTLAGRVRYTGPEGEMHFTNMLKETIFAATQQIRAEAGENDWCVSVFKDNAGVVRFDDHYNVVFKVETHNHPSALEPYGGANTGLGGVIRDPLGTGLGARPVCNTDVFCFAPPNVSADALPPGVLHPKRVARGVVSGVRDYGNRIGIPTVNGAIYFDPRYLGNPLVFCGNVGMLPRDKSFKEARAGDYIVAVGGRTGRDGIHGATFSSAELTSESESLSGGAVQIGNAITEKMVLDVLMQARDRGLYTAITDCGAGGFSSAVGEMGEDIGAEVWLDRVPLKYEGLSYTEIWISEAQERMVLSVPPEHWQDLSDLCAAENVEATIIGKFVPTQRLELHYHDRRVGDIEMKFLHGGRPSTVREAVYAPSPTQNQPLPEKYDWNYTPELLAILASPNVCSKEWVIRQYDHEVQGGSVVKPLVGATNDGPSDAAVVRPILGSRRGIVVACGMNPHYGDFDTRHMATSAIDEALRNCVAVGADPKRIAILDNFCWGDCERPETLGSLVRAALACRELATALETPFISGKDSLNNEFRYTADDGTKRTIAIPPSLLISALGQIDDLSKAVTMDLKECGNFLYQVGATKDELGGSHFALVQNLVGGHVPKVDPGVSKRTFTALHKAIDAGLVRACHDLSEGGLAAAVAEMAFAGNLGARVFLAQVPGADAFGVAAKQASSHSYPPQATAILLFSESNTRFLCEVRPDNLPAFEAALDGVPHALVGEVVNTGRLEIIGLPVPTPAADPDEPDENAAPLVITADLAALKQAWQTELF
ncbi:MAG TPA: phosphoribosylformylglycinamidine synthase subunit PurL [Pirellulales bacterium]|nr:phosphoribosylformylglycinamidine synthase subunit PurL [Pirellulales bacterium]